jgi:hypothetical protein
MDWVRDVPSNVARAQLSEAGLIDGREPKIVLSERGLVMVRHILELPLPRRVWVMQEPNAYIGILTGSQAQMLAELRLLRKDLATLVKS